MLHMCMEKCLEWDSANIELFLGNIQHCLNILHYTFAIFYKTKIHFYKIKIHYFSIISVVSVRSQIALLNGLQSGFWQMWGFGDYLC